MYKHYFGLRETPFSIVPDPRYLYMSTEHKEALAHLLYGMAGEGGFVLITGEVGTGKTTVSRYLLKQLPDTTDIAFIINPRQTVVELLVSICEELSLSFDETVESGKYYVDLLASHLLESHAAGRTTIVMIDEAQNLSTDVLEQLRLLTNLETDNKKLLQLILLGQPELQEKLALREMRQLSQRITARYHLEPLNLQETTAYIEYRLQVAGFNGALFDQRSIKYIHRYSAGIPRLINLLCDRAMLGVFAENEHKVSVRHIKRSQREISSGHRKKSWHWKFWRPGAPSVWGLFALALVFTQYLNS